MGYKLNYEIYKDVFSVPKSLTEKNLSVASANQLKVILCALSDTREISVEKISSIVGISEYECRCALDFWVERGFVFSDDSLAPPEKKVEGKKHANVKAVEMPEFSEVSKRAEEDPRIADLLQQAQTALGRTISRSEQRHLLYYHDDCGLPYEVILMLLGYAKSINKMGFNYIDKIAKSWADDDIDTYEKAEKQIDKALKTMSREHKVRKALGLGDRKFSTKESNLITRWVEEFHYDVDILSLGYDKTVDSIGKFDMKYLDKILTAWYQQGVKTTEEAEKASLESKPKGKEKKTSYDITEIEKNIFKNA